VQKTVSLGTKSFDEAIKYIDKTIADLEKAKEKIKNAGKKMITASNKITDITYKKLIKGCNNDPFNNNNGL
jgi:prefoldin subunit 5